LPIAPPLPAETAGSFDPGYAGADDQPDPAI